MWMYVALESTVGISSKSAHAEVAGWTLLGKGDALEQTGESWGFVTI